MIDWAEVMDRVPRERFIPQVIWRHERGRGGNDHLPVDRATDPDAWAAMVAADEPVVTQVDNGRPAPDGTGREVTSSSSDRRVVLNMLQLLDAQPGERVLEIGAGTGWNAALLAGGGAQVVSLEVDEQLAETALDNLVLAGYTEVTVVGGDGLLGWSVAAPYDRLIATVGVETVPAAWVEQTRLGGRLVVPLTNQWQPPGTVVLERTPSGAIGRIAARSAFMSVRSQHRNRLAGSSYTAPAEVRGRCDVHPHALAGDPDAATAIGQRVMEISWSWAKSNGCGVLHLFGGDGISWAWLDDEGDTEQAGPRRLLDEVLAAYGWWVEQSKPAREDWVVTVDLDGRQRIELRS